MGRRGVQVALGLLWLLDGALQLQPYMLGPHLSADVIAPASEGQPGFVSSGVSWAADLVAAHPMEWDLVFAAVQLVIGLGFLIPRFRVVRLAVVASVAWGLGVWYFGEGLGGLASGQMDLVTGAPGAVLLYVVLALAAWPTAPTGRRQPPPAAWLPIAWALLWLGGALWQGAPAHDSASVVAGDIRDSAAGAPDWLARLDRTTSAHALAGGGRTVGALVAVMVVVGLFGLVRGGPRALAAALGIALAAAMWLLGQGLVELATGRSTDPNSGPLLIVMALALVRAAPLRPPQE
ncbi:MAG: hypothetical protein ACJ786_01960 [Catenulispora sp.]